MIIRRIYLLLGMLINGDNMNVFSCIVILVEANLNGSRLEHERNLASRIVKFPPKYDHLGQQQMVSNLDLSMAIPKTSKHHRIQ